MFIHTFTSKIGPLYLEEHNGKLGALRFTPPTRLAAPAPGKAPSPLLAEAAKQLEAYFAGRLKNFDLPLEPQGTPFMQEVWKELCRIPYGSTDSYGKIAARLGRPGGARAVGLANNRNPIAVIIPCHRVIGAGGKLVGYAGGLDVKSALLRLEGAIL